MFSPSHFSASLFSNIYWKNYYFFLQLLNLHVPFNPLQSGFNLIHFTEAYPSLCQHCHDQIKPDKFGVFFIYLFFALILCDLSETFNVDDSSIRQTSSTFPHVFQEATFIWFPFFPDISHSAQHCILYLNLAPKYWEISTLPSAPPSNALFLGYLIQSQGLTYYLHAGNC